MGYFRRRRGWGRGIRSKDSVIGKGKGELGIGKSLREVKGEEMGEDGVGLFFQGGVFICA